MVNNKAKDKKKMIAELWKGVGKGKYIKINKNDGSMPTYKEFEQIMLN